METPPDLDGSIMVGAAFRIPRRLLALVDQAAKQGTRTRSMQLLRYTLQGLERDGLIKPVES